MKIEYAMRDDSSIMFDNIGGGEVFSVPSEYVDGEQPSVFVKLPFPIRDGDEELNAFCLDTNEIVEIRMDEPVTIRSVKVVVED